MFVLIALILLPLAAIGVQLAFDLGTALGMAGYSFYKIFFIVPPLIYCRAVGVSIFDDVLKLKNWRQHLPTAGLLGGLAILIFWGAYYFLGDKLLIDKETIVGKIRDQFGVTSKTIFFIAAITIFANSLLEEFFYRGFAFGLLVRKQRRLGYLLPATVFTIQHSLFIYHWVAFLPLVLALAALFVLALVLQKLYEQADSIAAPWLTHACGDIAMMGIAVTMLW